MADYPASINPTHTTASVTGASTAVLAANMARRYALIINDGAADVWLKLGAAAVANQGIRLNAGGGSYEITGAAGNRFLGAINGISAGTTCVLLVTEGV